MPNIGDVADWIITHRKKDSYKDSTRENIVKDLAVHSWNNTIYIVISENGIQALATASFEADNYMKINNVISLNTPALIELIKYFIRRWPNKGIISNIRGRIRHFENPQKLLTKLQNIWAKV